MVVKQTSADVVEIGWLPHRRFEIPPVAPTHWKATGDDRDLLIAKLQDEILVLKRELARLRDATVLDPLTKVLNRLGLERCLKLAMSKEAAAGRSHHLVMIDIDHFKKVNDTHGHVMGDRVLQVLAELLRSKVNEGRMQVVARYGGEEFALLLPNTTAAYAANFAEAMRDEVAKTLIRERRGGVDSLAIGITVSGGIAGLIAGEDEISWVSRADRALYKSKISGRNAITEAR
jgi:diguanylate cyclase